MASGTRLARSKIAEDDFSPKPKTRKLDKLNAPSPLKKQLGSTGKKVTESPLRRSVRTERFESPSTSTNSKKHSSSINSKNKKGDGSNRPSGTLDKLKKNVSPQAKKRKADDRSASSSTEDSGVSTSKNKKKRKLNGKNIASGVNDTKGEASGKKKVRKTLDVRTYKRLLTGQAGGRDGCLKENKPLQEFLSDLGENCSRIHEGGDIDRRKGDVCGTGDTEEVTLEPLEKDLKKVELPASNLDNNLVHDDSSQDNETKLGMFKDKQRNQHDTLVESSEKLTLHDEANVRNIESLNLNLEELDVSDGEVCYDNCGGKTSKINLKEQSIQSHTTVTLFPDICLVCKQRGQLVSCFGNGCTRSYHLSCLGSQLAGAWLCEFCVKKKLESGVYSVSDGIESVWDVEEGVQNGKQYFVKFKGLSHAHNRWIPESQILHDSPSLLAKFRKKNLKEKVAKWKKEWAEPERLLQKRLVLLPETSDEITSGSLTKLSNCCIEWFVKWKGLDYDQATWELENSLLLGSSEASRLVKDYGHWHEKAKMIYDPLRREKALLVKKDPFYKLEELPDGCPVELSNDLLDSLNNLREFWHKSINAILIEDQERFTKSVLFVLSLQCYASQPFLVITSSGSLPLWQAEFGRLAPSLNVVMYQGDKEVRQMIRSLEFYEESGCLMLQVLLADYEALIEDIDDINCIGWEVLFIDKCQNSKLSRYLEQIKTLNTNYKLLLFNGQLKDSLSEYCSVLSFLGRAADKDFTDMKSGTNEAPGALVTVKEKLAQHIAYERKVDSASFEEYWVPVPLSSVQLEQYCATLISNSNVLRSNSKSDVVGALHSILITTRKCCDHPYLVDGELRGLLTKGLQTIELLNAEVRASGKLFLLDRILHEMKSHRLRVVILFQSLGGPKKISLGDILDDFLQQRFGEDSYERIETGLVMTKKVAALKKFNDKESGRFVFLIEKRACLPSVKLQFVDAVILFDSDWNPLNDLRSLQKISIESKNNCIKVFRFYTSFTVEEKILMFAKQDTILESSIENISRNITHSLLAWGASYLFCKLDQFHSSSSTSCVSEPSFDKLCLNDVISEILDEFFGNVKTPRTVQHSILMKAQQSGAAYSGNIVLVGEKEGISLPDKEIQFLWPGLLEGKRRCWRHISDQSQRIRRQVHNFDGFVKRNEVESEVKKKRRKTNSIVDSVLPIGSFQEKKDLSNDSHKSHIVESEGWEPKLEEQRLLLLLLKPELSKLCDALGLPVSVKGKAQEFLVYIMNNHDVCSNQVTVLQALKISLCWRAASMSRYRLDRVDSLAIARRDFKFECTEEEAFSVYSRLRILKEKFSEQEGVFDNSMVNSLDSQSSHPDRTDSERKTLPGKAKKLTAFDPSAVAMTEGAPEGCISSEQLISPKQDHLSHGTPTSIQLNVRPVEDKPLNCLIDLIDKVSSKRAEDLSQLHQAEVLQLEKEMCDERVQLEIAHGLDLEFFRSIHIDLAVINGKISLLNREFFSRMDRRSQHLKKQKEKLLFMQLDIRNKEQELKNSWLLKAKAGLLEKFFDNVPLPETGFKAEKYQDAIKYASNCTESRTRVLNSAHPSNGTRGSIESEKAPLNEFNDLEECCHEVSPNGLQGSAEDVRLSNEARSFQSVKNSWLLKAKAAQLEESFGNVPLPETGFKAEKFQEAIKYASNCTESRTRMLNSVHPSNGARTSIESDKAPLNASNELEECFHEVAPNSLQVSAEDIRLSNEAPSFQSVMSNNNMGLIEPGRLSEEPLIPPGMENELPMNAVNQTCQSEAFNQCNNRQAEFVDYSTIPAAVDGNQGDRDNLIVLHLASNSGLNQGHIRSSVQGLQISTTAGTLLSLKPVRPVAAAASVSVQSLNCSLGATFPQSNSLVSPLSPIQVMCCNDAAPSSCTNCHQVMAEHELGQVSPVGYQEVSCPVPYFPNVQQTEVAALQTILEPAILQIPDSMVHPQRSHDSLFERTSSMHFRGNDSQPLSFARPTCVVPTQHRISGTVVENTYNNQQIADNSLHLSTRSHQEELPSERGATELLRSAGQTDLGSHSFLNPVSTGWVPTQAVYADPFQNELLRIRKQNDLSAKKHEDKKVQLQLEYEIELDKVRRKYDALYEDAERESSRDKRMFQAIYDKVFWHKVFAEEVRSKFYDHRESVASLFQGSSLNLSQQLQTSASQHQLPYRSSTAPSIPPSTSTAIQESTTPLLTSVRSRTHSLALASIHHLSMAPSQAASSALSGNTARGPTASRASLQVGRSPAPHLQRFRPNTPTAPIPSIQVTLAPSAPSSDLGPAVLLPSPQLSFPASGGPSSLHSSSPMMDESAQDVGVYLLESLLSNIPAMGNDVPASSMVDLRPNASPDIICLSDDE